MINRFIRAGVVVLIVLALQAGVFAANKTMFILGQNITSLGNPVNAPNSDIKFTRNGTAMILYVPGTTTQITDFNITDGKVDDKGSPAGRNVQVNCNVGDSLRAVVWEGKVGEGGYYGSKTLSMNQANFDNPTLPWNWDGLKVNYKAAAPFTPRITKFEETITSFTDATPPVATVKAYGAAGTGTAGELREVSGTVWKWWLASGTEPTSSNGSGNPLVLGSTDVTAGETYSFRVGQYNQWEGNKVVWSDPVNHKIGMPEPVAASFTFELFPVEVEKLVVNSIFLPKFTLTSPEAITITKASDLAGVVNREAGEKIVVAICKWDPEAGAAVAAIFDPAGDAIQDVGTLVTGSEDFEITKLGEAYQIYTTKQITITLQ